MARPIKVISSMATRRLLEALLPAFERQSGCAIEFIAMGGNEAAQSVRSGCGADIVILASQTIAKLAADGFVVPETITDIAASGIALAVPAGHPHPVIASESDVKAAMIAANAIGFSTGPSGDHLKRLWSKWGVTDRLAPRSVQAPPGMPVANLLARGDVDLGIQQASELRDVQGVDIVGPLPPDIQATTIFSAARARSSDIEEANSLLAYLRAPETADLKRQFGLDAPG